jgi:hypothetical protein
VSSTHITYSQRPDTRPEAELTALASVYRFVLDCHEKKAAYPGGPDDAVVRHKEEVRHVEQRPDKPSESTYPAAL